MEDILKNALPEAKIEVPEAVPAPIPETEGGFPWCGVGVGVGVVVLAAILAKLYKCTAKK